MGEMRMVNRSVQEFNFYRLEAGDFEKSEEDDFDEIRNWRIQ